jgi:hypothetical protein
VTDQQKLIKEAAKVARTAWYANVTAPDSDQWQRVARGQKDFWASHAEPEMGLGEVLRQAAEYVDKRVTIKSGLTGETLASSAWLRKEALRLDAETQQRERDVRIGRAIRKRFYIEDTKAKPFDDIDLTLGIAAREAVEAEK